MHHRLVFVFVLLSSASVFAGQSDISGLLFYHDFEQQTPTQFLDASGNNQHMTKMRGLESSTDAFRGGNAGKFVGTSTNESNYTQYGQLPASGWPTGNSTRTMTGWVKDTGTHWFNGHDNTFGVFMNYGAGNADNKAFGMGTHGGKLAFWDGGALGTTSALLLPQNAWHFVAIVYDGDKIKFWVDRKNETKDISKLNTSLASVNIGGEIGRTPHPHFLKGNLDELRLYNRALSDREILKIIDDCNDECLVSGEKSCSASGIPQECGNTDSDVCYEIITRPACSPGLVCASGQCIACLPGQTQACYSGASSDVIGGNSRCRSGTQACTAGAWGACTGQVLPEAQDACNGIDDNCNGSVDEGFGVQTCGVGACQRTTNVCDNGGMQACVSGTPGSREICGNGIDDDCNGKTDAESEGCVAKLGTITLAVSPNPLPHGEQALIRVGIQNTGTLDASVVVQAAILNEHAQCTIHAAGTEACTSITLAIIPPGSREIEFTQKEARVSENRALLAGEKNVFFQAPVIDAPSIDTRQLAPGNYIVSALVTLDGKTQKTSGVLTVFAADAAQPTSIPEVHPLLSVLLAGVLILFAGKKWEQKTGEMT